MKLVPTLNIMVEGVPLCHGVEVDSDTIPAGCLTSLLRLGQLVEPKNFDSFPVEEKSRDWQDTSVDELDLTPISAGSLRANKLLTVRAIIAYGKVHGTLTKLDGIGAASEKQIQKAIKSLRDDQ